MSSKRAYSSPSPPPLPLIPDNLFPHRFLVAAFVALTIFLSTSAPLVEGRNKKLPQTDASHPLKLVRLDSDDEARCLDGSPGTYYIWKGSNEKKWQIHLQGGGWCT